MTTFPHLGYGKRQFTNPLSLSSDPLQVSSSHTARAVPKSFGDLPLSQVPSNDKRMTECSITIFLSLGVNPFAGKGPIPQRHSHIHHPDSRWGSSTRRVPSVCKPDIGDHRP